MGGLGKYNKDKDTIYTKPNYTFNTTYLSPHKIGNPIVPLLLASLLHAQNE